MCSPRGEGRDPPWTSTSPPGLWHPLLCTDRGWDPLFEGLDREEGAKTVSVRIGPPDIFPIEIDPIQSEGLEELQTGGDCQ